MLRFARRFFAPRFVRPVPFTVFIFARPFFARMFRASIALRFVARRLDPAQGAPEVFDFPFVANLLLFRQFNQFQNVLHLLESFFQGFHDPAHLICRLGERWGSVLLGMLRSLLFRPRPSRRLRFRVSPFGGLGLRTCLVMGMFFRRRRRRLIGGGRRSGSRWGDGVGRTQAASTTATATTPATG